MVLSLEGLHTRYPVRPLTDSDVPAIYALCKGNPAYYQQMQLEPTPENLRADLTVLPPSTTPEDKHFLGFFQDGRLIAILDLITRYPASDCAYIGWFMLDSSVQRGGVGTELIAALLQYLKEARFCRVRLGCVKGNEAGFRFWQKNGFAPDGDAVVSEHYTIIPMERAL